MTDADGHLIAQAFLDGQGEATLAGDIDATLEYCDIPCTLESMDGRVVATNTADMRAICETFIAGVRAKRLTHMVRKCLEAEFQDENTLCATYETRYIQDGKLLAEEPYVGFVVLRRKEGRWKISTMLFAVSGNNPASLTIRERMHERHDL